MAEKKKISSEDEAWLNHEANMVDEQRVIEALETASDYERGFQRLNDVQKGLVRKLREIFQAVVDARKAQDESEITGGDDVDDDAQIEALPTRCEVLKAVSVISNYVDLNDPFAGKLEAVLGSFRRDLHLESSRAMVSTQLTDYFH